MRRNELVEVFVLELSYAYGLNARSSMKRVLEKFGGLLG